MYVSGKSEVSNGPLGGILSLCVPFYKLYS